MRALGIPSGSSSIVVFVMMVAACQPATSSPSPKKNTDTGQPFEIAPPSPTWTAEQVQETMIQGLSGGLPQPRQAMDAFARILEAGSDGRCPNAGSYTITESFSGCLSERGYRFAGLTIFEPAENANFTFLGDCYVIDPDGDTFLAAGEIEQMTDLSTQSFTGKLTGTWGYPKESGWLQSVPSLALWLQGDAGSLDVNGGWSSESAVLYFRDLHSGPDCATSGGLELQDPQGSWYQLDYGEDCDACGQLSYAGDAYGEICVPFADTATLYRRELGL